jgi:hypothetical protein
MNHVNYSTVETSDYMNSYGNLVFNITLTALSLLPKMDHRAGVFWAWTAMRGDGDHAIATRVASFLGVTI